MTDSEGIVDLVNLYKCLCDRQRLRILNLLKEGPLCVCHLQELLDETQVKISKQLGYMKKLKMVTSTRQGNWMIYRLAEPSHPLLSENLRCLQDCAAEYPVFRDDLVKREAIVARIQTEGSPCPGAVVQPAACSCE